jgi:hypothetical protein
LVKLQKELLDTKKLLQELTIKLERLSEI